MPRIPQFVNYLFVHTIFKTITVAMPIWLFFFWRCLQRVWPQLNCEQLSPLGCSNQIAICLCQAKNRKSKRKNQKPKKTFQTKTVFEIKSRSDCYNSVQTDIERTTWQCAHLTFETRLFWILFGLRYSFNRMSAAAKLKDSSKVIRAWKIKKRGSWPRNEFFHQVQMTTSNKLPKTRRTSRALKMRAEIVQFVIRKGKNVKTCFQTTIWAKARKYKTF